MTDPIHYEAPETRDQIVASLNALNDQATPLWARFDATAFFARPPDGGWSPAGNVEHLIKSTVPVTRALRLPRWLLRLVFGRARIHSRAFVELRAAYRSALADGGQAGSYAPSDKPPAEREAEHARLLAAWQDLVPRLTENIARWDDAALDYYRLPHPLLGKLTLREMLFFTLYHLGHHANVVACRQQESPGSQGDGDTAAR